MYFTCKQIAHAARLQADINMQMQRDTDVWALLPSSHSAPATYNKPASLPGRNITREQPQLASSDCLMSSHILTPEPQQRPYPNHTNFPFLQTNPPQNCSAIDAKKSREHYVDSGFPKATLAWVSCLLGWTWYEIIAYSQMSIKFEELITKKAEKKGFFSLREIFHRKRRPIRKPRRAFMIQPCVHH